MAVSKEVKVGLLALVAGSILYLGFNFLKGEDFFSSTNKYYAVYDNIDGLTVSNPVILNGLSIGRVNSIKLMQDRGNKVLVEIKVNADIIFGDSTQALLANSDLLGGKSILIKLGKNSKEFKSGDTLIAYKEKGLTEAIQEKAMPIITNLDTTIVRVNKLLADDMNHSVKNIMKNFEEASKSLKLLLAANQSRISSIAYHADSLTLALIQTTNSFKPIVAKMNKMADTLNSLELKKITQNANATLENLNSVIAKLKTDEGSLGAMINEKEMYNNLNKTLKDLDSLIVDFQYNPNHYLAPLGKKPKKKKKKGN